jgi:hypothetical protein
MRPDRADREMGLVPAETEMEDQAETDRAAGREQEDSDQDADKVQVDWGRDAGMEKED